MNKNFFRGHFLLHHYAGDEQVECVKTLLAHLKATDFEARFDAYCEGQIECWPYEEEYFPGAKDYIDSLDSSGWSALDCAAEAGPTYPESKGAVISAVQIEIVKILLDAGADPDLYDRHHHKPQHFEFNPALGDAIHEAIKWRDCKEVLRCLVAGKVKAGGELTPLELMLYDRRFHDRHQPQCQKLLSQTARDVTLFLRHQEGWEEEILCVY